MLKMATTTTTKLKLRESKRATSQWTIEACNTEDDDLLVFGDILHRTVPRLLCATSSQTVEDTFVHNAVSDLLHVVFGEDQRLPHEWATKKLPCIKVRLMMTPDCMAATKAEKKTPYFLSVAVKPPARTSDSDVCEDRVKRGNQIKTMMQTRYYN
ncbi:hypothetical protein BDC45DRAFT_26302 [Circinella umbellata]|nr:hypothetical protein BDC45DRAFT_26302 [Circinella umbellata]